MFKDEVQEKDIERFYKYVDKRADDECWEWQGTLDYHGYGVYSLKRVLYKAHRASLFFSGNDVPSHLHCCHTCDNPRCVNPNHLWMGTVQDNMRDRQNKGRTRTGHLHGEDNTGAKLTEEAVLFIRANYDGKEYSQTKLAKMFGVCKTNIRNVLNRKSWKHI